MTPPALDEYELTSTRAGTSTDPVTTTTRRRTPRDASAVRALHDATRADDVAGWPEAAAEAFLDLQYRAREAALPPEHEDLLIEVAGQFVGRVVCARSGPGLCLIILEVLPELRGRGIGGSALAELCARADAQDWAIDLHVLPGNPAIALYRRHGFRSAAPHGFHLGMTRPPAPTRASAAQAQP